MCVGDLHLPFIDKVAFGKLLSFVEQMPQKPSHIVQVGDLFDFFSFSRFPRSPNIMSPQEEILTGRAAAEEVWLSLKHRAPEALCYQLLGNHDLRIGKRLKEKFPEICDIVDLSDLWKFDGVQTTFDDREPLVIDDIHFIHGFKTVLGSHSRHFMSKVVCGHSHRGGVALIPTATRGLIYELNCGFLADVNHEALKYTPSKITNWTTGFGLIDSFGPRFVSL